MLRCGYKVVPLIAFCCLWFLTSTRASPDSTSLPSSLLKEMEIRRQEDDLSRWIYARLDYVEKAPFNRIGFLMSTQQAAWRKYTTYQERIAWFNLLLLQGYYQLQTGNILASINAYEAAMEFYDSYPLAVAETDEYVNYVLKPLGNNYTRLADYNTAFYIHQKTLAIVLKKKNNQEIAATYNNLSICAKWKGELMAADSFCRKGLVYVDKRSGLHGLLLNTRTELLIEQQRFDTAALVSRQAVALLQPLADRFKNDDQLLHWYTSSLQLSARIELYHHRYDKALQQGSTVLQLLNRHFPASGQRQKAKVKVMLGDITLAAGKASQAAAHYHEALLLLLPSWKPMNTIAIPPDDQLYSENTLADALAGKAAALSGQQQQAAALQHYLAVFRAARVLRTAFYSTESKIRDLQLLRSRANAVMQLAYELWTSTHETSYRDHLLLIAELSKAQVLLDEREGRSRAAAHLLTTDTVFKKINRLQEAVTYYQHELMAKPGDTSLQTLLQSTEYELSLVQKKIKQATNAHGSVTTMLTIAQLPGLCKLLPANTTVLEFFEGISNSYIIEVDRSGVTGVQLIAHSQPFRKQVQDFMQHWFGHGAAAMINAPQQFYKECHGIYATIFGSQTWKKDQRYLLIPDGVFNYLPFDALLTEPAYSNDYHQWPYLFKKVSLSQAYSLQTWCDQQSLHYAPGRFAAFFVSKGQGRQQPVLSVEKERVLLENTIPGTYFFNATATWQTFNRMTDSVAILHIGTHAISSGSDAFPYLRLYDQPYYLFDLRYKNFSPALVVLGACKTGDGALLEGEGVNSLSRGFVAAGAGGVVSGLWNVNDETATDLVKIFYEQLREGNDPAMALYKAKQQWLQTHRDNMIWQLPYYWSGFMYTGHLQQVPLPGGNNNAWRWYLGAGILLAAGLAWYWTKRKRLS